MKSLTDVTPPTSEKQTDLCWHALHSEEVLSTLKTSLKSGLTSEKAAERLKQYGPNQLQEAARPTFLKVVIQQLNNFIVILLIVAAGISALLGDWIEASVILAIVILNAVLGVIQERRAEEALAALRKLAAPEALVLRDGHRLPLPAHVLVPGDIVFLEAGNYIPADVRLLEAVNLRVEEAALTGESVPVQKNAGIRLKEDIPLGDRKNTAFMGTLVSYGRGQGVVVSTGMHTQLGLIATMLQAVEQEETPLQRSLDQLGKFLGWGCLAVCVVVFLVSLLRHHGGLNEIVDVFMIAVSLAIAAVPEGLPAVVTISLALGMREMIKRHALIRRLSSVETLGSATVICSDKTGTLTQNEMTVVNLWVDEHLVEITGSGYQPRGRFLMAGKPIRLEDFEAVQTALFLGVINNDACLEASGVSEQELTYRMVGDPTEGAILVAASKAGFLAAGVNEACPRQGEIPFDSTRKRMVTLHALKDPEISAIPLPKEMDRGEVQVVAVKGAPDVVLDLCRYYLPLKGGEAQPLDETYRKRILDANDAMTRNALRVLGLAYRLVCGQPADPESPACESDLVFTGLIGMIDPARPEVKPAIETARRAGIRTIMITGDYLNTARAIAESIGLLRPGRHALTGADLNTLSDEALQREVKETDVFARVSPEHKVKIVEALRKNKEVVAMTGDGVNDAPALKRADIGVAMGITGTDVAKETADMVLTDDNYASIVSATEQGRIIYANIRKFVFFLLSSNVAEIMVIFLPSLFGFPTPLTAIQLLWLNLITDGAPALALAMEKGDPDVMLHPPRPKDESIIDPIMRRGIIVQTITQTAAVLLAFGLGLYWVLDAKGAIPTGGQPLLFLFGYDWSGLDVQTAETMAFVTLSLCELFRAYTVRSEKASLFTIGIFSNKYMQAAVGLSLLLLALVVVVPFLQPVFNTHTMSLKEWGVVIGLSLIPAVSEEITKAYSRYRDR